MADPDLSLVSDEQLATELKKRYDVLVLYADRVMAETPPRHEIYRITRGNPLAVYGLARIISQDATDELEKIMDQLAEKGDD